MTTAAPRRFIVVSHTHWDREWYLPFEAFRVRLVRMMDALIELFERDPGFKHFVLDGQTVPLDDYLEIRPERRETIDRLVRGSVGVDQIRGPVGIVHIGAKVADRGFMYLVFFLGIISVNLAVINFLPLPIVDGGLFLFLIYEKLKGRPPPLAFQNAATIAGVAMIATVLLVVTWNDLMRLMG